MSRAAAVLLLAAALVPVRAPAQAIPRVELAALTLADAERLVAARNREVLVARRALEGAQADVVSAGAAPNPVVTLNAGVVNPQSGLGKAAIPGAARIEQLIERGGKRELRVAAAQRLESAANAELADTLRQQRLATVSAYYDLLLAQDKVATAGVTADLFAKSVAATERRLAAGDVAPADLTRLRVEALRAENERRAAEAERQRAQNALAYLIGAEREAAAIRAADPWPSLEEVAHAAIDDALLDARPDVAAARERLEAANKARELARSLATRDVTLGAGIERTPPSETNTVGVGTIVGVSVSFPLFLRYTYEGEIARAEADYTAAIELLEIARAQARTELGTAAADLAAAAERLRRYEVSLLAEARKAADYAEFAYRNGAIGVIDLLDARRTLRAVELDAAAARADYAKALARWRSGLARHEPASPARRP
ncbi:MAG: TolC family protein [Burkholderiales bacterium]|nr:TolC family protein [Burkholderiales bacterium]